MTEQIRLGVIVPSVNIVVEEWYPRVVPDGVSVHFARMLIGEGSSPERIIAMDREDGSRAIRQLAAAGRTRLPMAAPRQRIVQAQCLRLSACARRPTLIPPVSRGSNDDNRALAMPPHRQPGVGSPHIWLRRLPETVKLSPYTEVVYHAAVICAALAEEPSAGVSGVVRHNRRWLSPRRDTRTRRTIFPPLIPALLGASIAALDHGACAIR